MLKSLSNSLLHSSLALLSLGAMASSALAEDYSFFVTNGSNVNIVGVQTQMLGGPWGSFDLSGAITPGEHIQLHWGANTNDQSCTQFVRAKFADGSYSKPAKFNFCSTPDIVFQ